MRRILLIVSLALLWASQTLGYSGPCGVWFNAAGTYTSTNKPGTQAGFNAALTAVGQKGSIWVYPGCEGAITVPATLPDSVTVYMYDGGKWTVYSKSVSYRDRSGTQRFAVDSTGVTFSDLTVPGHIVGEDSVRTAQLMATNGIISRLGPASGATFGGAIRIVDGVAFASWSSAVSDLPTNGAIVLYPDSSRLWLRNKGAALFLRDASPGWNGATDPVFGSDKTLNLATASSGQAAKSVDIKSIFSGTTAYTNLSLNGLHAINQYGVSGSGGGDVATGIALGGYSEYRGGTTITGSLYGAELASSMINNGTVSNLFGSLNTAQISSGTSTVTNLRGMQALARIIGSSTGTVTLALAAEGVASLNDNAAGTVTDAIGGRFSVTKAGGATGTITAATALYVNSPTAGSTNNFGVRIAGTPSGGSNVNQALRVDSGPTFLGGTLVVGNGSTINKILRSSATLDFDLSAVNCQDLTVTVTGAAVGDEVFVGAPNGSIVTDETITAWVSATNTVTIRACDGAASGNPASGTYKVTVFQ